MAVRTVRQFFTRHGKDALLHSSAWPPDSYMKLIFLADVHFIGNVYHGESDEPFEMTGRLDEHSPSVSYSQHKQEKKCLRKNKRKLPVAGVLGDE